MNRESNRKPDISFEGTLQSFFFERISDVQDRLGTHLEADIEAYIVHLLANYVRTTGLAGRRSKALALQYLSARECSGSARAQALRQVGDRALFIVGVVPRSLNPTPVNVRYVRSIGESAYRQVSHGQGALAVFHTLADNFEEASEVIGEAVEPVGKGENNLLELYERWRRYGNTRDAKRLLDAGVRLDPQRADIIQ